MSEIKFLNIDLEIESKENIAPLVKEFEKHWVVFHFSENKGLYSASFETAQMSTKEIINEYFKVIDSLNGAVLELWKNCLTRKFDIGFDSGHTPRSFSYELSKEVLNKIISIRGTINITIYPTSNNENS